MSSDIAQSLFQFVMVLLNAAGSCVVAHLASSAAVRATIPAKDSAFDHVFGSPMWGDVLARHAWLVRTRFFWPWVSSPSELASRGLATRALFWVARLAGAGAAACFVGFLATMVYIGIRSA